jgi:serine/threonine protein kinase
MNSGGVSGEVLSPGSVLVGKFDITGLLGRGGFGITYDGFDKRLKRRVAIKELFPDGAVRQGSEVLGSNTTGIDHLRTRFIEEAQALAKFDFPGIVRVLEAFEDNGTAYMVMEHLDGENLEQRIDRVGRLTSDETTSIVSQLCATLSQVHAAGMLHRDMKPSNVILHPTRGAVLIDFGSARELALGAAKAHTQMVSHGYAAPEQYSANSRLGPPTDVYGLGATAWHAVTGEAPPSTLDRVSGAVLPPIAELVPGIAPQLAALIETSLQMDFVSRPANMAEAQRILEATSPSGEWPKTAPKSGTQKTVVLPSGPNGTTRHAFPEPARPNNKRGVLVGVGIAALAISGTVAVFATRSPKSDSVAIDTTATTTSETSGSNAPTVAPQTPTPVSDTTTSTTRPTTTEAVVTTSQVPTVPSSAPATALPGSPQNLKFVLFPTSDSVKAKLHENAIQLAIRDAKDDLAKAGVKISLVVSRIPSAVSDDAVVAVFSNGGSEEAMLRLSLPGMQSKEFIPIDGTSNELTESNPNVFRTIASDSDLAREAAKAAANSGATSALILSDGSEASISRGKVFAEEFPGARTIVLNGSNTSEAVDSWKSKTAVFIAASSIELVQPVLESSTVSGAGRIVLGVDGMMNLTGNYLRGARCFASNAPVLADAAFSKKLRAADLGKSDEEASLFAYTSAQAVLREIVGGATTGDALIVQLRKITPQPQVRMYTYTTGWN